MKRRHGFLFPLPPHFSQADLGPLPAMDSLTPQQHPPAVKVASATHTPVLIVGQGLAGVITALLLAQAGVACTVLGGGDTRQTSSYWAQGGIAAVMSENVEDSLESHVADTLVAGAGQCDEVAVRSILQDGELAIETLEALGVQMDRGLEGDMAFGREGSHSHHRIIHVEGDATGRGVMGALLPRAQANPLIHWIDEPWTLTELAKDSSGQVTGAIFWAQQSHHLVAISAPAVVLATGGCARLYRHSTNPATNVGDGLAVAAMAGVSLAEMGFLQFHPTAFVKGGEILFLISEAMRGEGGVLRGVRGERFAPRFHPDGELAPRDVVTRAIMTFLHESGDPTGNVYLDMTHMRAEALRRRFPSLYDRCQQEGIALEKDWIPVTPAAHYLMGGIPVSVSTGETSLANLFAVGECSRTGLHGANRLASNSLLECVVMGRRVAAALAERKQALLAAFRQQPLITQCQPQLPDVGSAYYTRLRQAVALLLWQQVGVVRTPSGLRSALASLQAWESSLGGHRFSLPYGAACYRLLQVAKAIAHHAQSIPYSVGAHFIEKDAVNRDPLLPPSSTFMELTPC